LKAVATDVLIVGAGPTGLMLANQLARRGVRAQIIDRHAGPAVQTRALGVQARTLEIYAQLGIADEALELGKRATGANLWAQGRFGARVPLGDIGRDLSPFPFLLILGQDDNERLLGTSLSRWDMAVQWNTELVALQQHAGGVKASLRQADGRLVDIDAAWVAGCDGAHSAVRDLNGVDFVGAAYEHVFFVADTQVTGPMVADELNVYLWRDGFHLFFPMRGQDHWRVVGILPAPLRSQPGLGFEQVVPAVRAEVGSDLSFEACSWFSTYRIHHRRAERFRQGRCFLLGDAAHVHSPVGAQGMNTGLQDAYNLAWKLALVTKGDAGEALLDSFEAERVPVAQRLLDTTDRAFTLVASDSWPAGLLRTQVLANVVAFAMRRERVRKLAFRTVSQTGIHYRGSPLSLTQRELVAGTPRAGDRFPWLRLRRQPDGPVEDLFAALDDLHFHLLLFGQAAPALGEVGADGGLRVHAIPDHPDNARELERATIAAPSFYLLRPDGHVGLAGARLEPGVIAHYLSDRLHWVGTD
jgi:2-polyprenyl-6-methoxyphenol hydroxylase-like FAD-dependent oxidoreductase